MTGNDAERPIADSYAHLQSLPQLFKLVREDTIERGSEEQAARALFQSSEICVATISACIDSCTTAMTSGDAFVQPLRWASAYAATWSDLAWRITDLDQVPSPTERAAIAMSASSNVRLLHRSEEQFAELYPSIACEETDDLILALTLAERRALDHARRHEVDLDYDTYSRCAEIRALVLDTQVPTNTAFIPFRSAHQVSEVLVDAANDHIELLLTGSLGNLVAARALLRIDRLLDAAVGVVEMFARSLTQVEYHKIRSFLGVTSGSHSVGIHYHLMRDLYPALARRIFKDYDSSHEADAILYGLIRSIGVHLDRWRLAHVALPRNNLGGAGTNTRSLAGASDSLTTVTGMRVRARTNDPLRPVGDSSPATDWSSDAFPMAPLEHLITRSRSEQTQDLFTNVQARRGIYANAANFRAPRSRVDLRDGSEEL